MGQMLAVNDDKIAIRDAKTSDMTCKLVSIEIQSPQQNQKKILLHQM